MSNLLQNPTTTATLTHRFPGSRPITHHYRATFYPQCISTAISELLANPHIPPFLKWGFQALYVSYLLPANRGVLFRALFRLASRSFTVISKPNETDPSFIIFYEQALLLDPTSVHACLKKLHHPGQP